MCTKILKFKACILKERKMIFVNKNKKLHRLSWLTDFNYSKFSNTLLYILAIDILYNIVEKRQFLIQSYFLDFSTSFWAEACRNSYQKQASRNIRTIIHAPRTHYQPRTKHSWTNRNSCRNYIQHLLYDYKSADFLSFVFLFQRGALEALAFNRESST